MHQFHAIVSQFGSKTILVLGDVMLDRYIYGDVMRISLEAPVPVIDINREMISLGGAANTAHNIKTLGGSVILVGITGNDRAKDVFIEELQKDGISDEGLVSDPRRKTTEKIRVVGNEQQIARIDYETREPITPLVEDAILERVKTFLPRADIIVFSDYAKGFFTQGLVARIKELAHAQKKNIIVDPKPEHKSFYTGVYLLTPNTKEAQGLSGISNTIEAGARLVHELGAHVLLTEGAHGMRLFEQGKNMIHIPTRATEVYDVAGAGDTVMATVALALAAGSSLQDAAILANYAAGIVVRKRGTATVTPEELESVLKASLQ